MVDVQTADAEYDTKSQRIQKTQSHRNRTSA